MKKFDQSIIELYDTFKGIVKILLKSKYNVKLPYNLKTYEECLVIGNGPSAIETLRDVEFMKNKDLFCVNSFSLSEEYTIYKPKFYVFADPGFFAKNVSISTLELRNKVFYNILNKTEWKTAIFIPFGTPENELENNNINKNVLIYKYNINSIKGYSFFRHWVYKKNIAIPPATNVLIPALILAINLGYKTIYLTGADHSWLESIYLGKDNVLYKKDIHFYENEEKLTYTPIKDAATQKKSSMIDFFNFYIKALESYHIIEKYSKYMNCKIYNVSSKTYIDAFERK